MNDVSFPVARHGAIGCLRRTLADHDLGREEGLASPARARPRHPQHAPGVQAGRQFATQRASTLNEQRLIDGFVADAHGLVVREIHRQATGDLLRAPGVCPPPVLPCSMPTFSRTRPGREQELRSKPRRREPTVPPHRFLTRRCVQASPALGDEQLARRAIALSSRDTRGRRFWWRHCAATPGRSSTLPARAGERLPAWWCPAREGARSPRALQTRDIGRREASPIVQTSLVACRLPSGTISFRQPAAHRLRSQQPHSPCRPRWLPRTVAARLVLPLAVALGTAMAP